MQIKMQAQKALRKSFPVCCQDGTLHSPKMEPYTLPKLPDETKWWQKDEALKTVFEHETSGNLLFEREFYAKAFNIFGKAFSAASDKGLMGKIPSPLLKMGMCQRKLAENERDVSKQLMSARSASHQIGMALDTCHFNGEASQSSEWILSAVKEASNTEKLFFEVLIPQVENMTKRLQAAEEFVDELLSVHLLDHPFHDVSVSVNKQVAFMAFDKASECLKNNDHQGARQNLQIMVKCLERANASYALQRKNDPELTQELKVLSEDYLTSCDIAQALEALEAGDLITGLATGELEAKDVEAALNHGWNALDLYKEAENLTESTVDDICYQSKVAQGLLYQHV